MDFNEFENCLKSISILNVVDDKPHMCMKSQQMCESEKLFQMKWWIKVLE